MEKNLSTGDKKNKSNKVENFAELLEESFSKEVKKVGSLVSGKVVAIEKEAAVVDIGFKSEGRVPLKDADLSTAEDRGQLNFLDECDGMCGV